MKTAAGRLDPGEAAFQSSVIELAQRLGWKVAHFRRALTVDRRGRQRWQTPVTADGAGFPDLVLVRRGVLIFAELKTDTGTRPPAQRAWLRDLEDVPRSMRSPDADRVLVRVWRPRDWLELELELRGARRG